MSAHGPLTAKMGEFLESTLEPRYEVYYDHGQKKPNVGKIVSWFGDDEQPHRATELGQLDIAIVDIKTKHAVLLVEIEETNDTPKGLIADAFATLMGSKITFVGTDLLVGAWTSLLILGKGSDDNGQRNRHLSDQIEACRAGLATANASIGRVSVQSFLDQADLKQNLLGMIPAAA